MAKIDEDENANVVFDAAVFRYESLASLPRTMQHEDDMEHSYSVRFRISATTSYLKPLLIAVYFTFDPFIFRSCQLFGEV